MGYFIKELTYEQLRPLITERSVVVLPIGGGAKEHGNHLPMGTDYFVTDWVANAVTARENVLTLPTLPYAYFPAFVHWEGSVSVSHQHFTSYVRDILECYVRFGVKKFLIIDGGVSTHPPLCLMARDMNNELGVKAVSYTHLFPAWCRTPRSFRRAARLKTAAPARPSAAKPNVRSSERSAARIPCAAIMWREENNECCLLYTSRCV